MAPSAAHKAARWALGQMATRAQIEAMAAGRQLVEGSATSWRRVTDSDPCGFCAMLASRGPVYQSRAAALDAAGRGSAVQSMYRADGSRKSGGTAKGVKARGARQLGEKYHAYCGCTAEPFYGSWEEWEPTPEEQVYRQAYEAAYWYNIDDLELPTKIHTLLHDPTSATPEMFERFVAGMDERQFKALTEKWRANGVSTRGLEAVWTKANLAPRIDWEALTTSREIADKLAEVMKDTGTITGLDNPRHAVEKVRDAATTIADLVQRYPQVKFNLTVKPVRKNGVLAQATGAWRRSPSGVKEMNPDTLEMIVNSGKLSKASVMGVYPEAERETFWWSLRPEVPDVKTFDYIVRHEFGHLVDFFTQNYTTKTVKATSVFTEVAKSGGLEPPPRYFYRASPRNSPESVANFDAWNAMLSTERSKYGQTNDAEGIAEAFADVEVNGAYASQTSRIVIERLLALLKEAT